MKLVPEKPIRLEGGSLNDMHEVDGDVEIPGSHALTLRLDIPTYERLRSEAFEQRTTITNLIRRALAVLPVADNDEKE